MWKNLVLCRLLRLTTASDEMYCEAIRFFGVDDKDDGAWKRALTAGDDPGMLCQLPPDQRATVYRFLKSEVFAKNMIRCLAFMASAKIAPHYQSERNDDLVNQFNSTVKPVNKVDVYRVLSFLNVVGDELLLSENSAIFYFPPNWLTFLGTFALAEGCSVWSIPRKSLTQTILTETPNSFFVPTYMVCWILNPTEQNGMIKDLLKCRNKKKADEIRTRLIHFLYCGKELKPKIIHTVIRHLMKAGIGDKELDTLLLGKNADAVKQILQNEYGVIL